MQVAPRIGAAYRLTDNTVPARRRRTFYVPSTTRFQDGPTNNPVNNRTNNIATSLDSNRTFFTDLSNPFPTGVDNYPRPRPQLPAGPARGHGDAFLPRRGRLSGPDVSVQRRPAASFTNSFSAEVAYTGLRRQASAEYPEPESTGARVHRPRRPRPDRVQPHGQRGHSAGSARLHGVTTRHLLRRVPAPDRAESARRGGPRGRIVDADGAARAPARPVPAVTSANQQGYFGQSSYNALQMRADKRFGAAAW